MSFKGFSSAAVDATLSEARIEVTIELTIGGLLCVVVIVVEQSTIGVSLCRIVIVDEQSTIAELISSWAEVSAVVDETVMLATEDLTMGETIILLCLIAIVDELSTITDSNLPVAAFVEGLDINELINEIDEVIDLGGHGVDLDLLGSGQFRVT